MTIKKVNSVVALFDTPDQIIHAAENTVKAVIRISDVYSLSGTRHGSCDESSGYKSSLCNTYVGCLGLALRYFSSMFQVIL